MQYIFIFESFNESVEKVLFEKAPIPIIDDGAPGISWIIVPVR
jgi:hypothetical protein